MLTLINDRKWKRCTRNRFTSVNLTFLACIPVIRNLNNKYQTKSIRSHSNDIFRCLTTKLSSLSLMRQSIVKIAQTVLQLGTRLNNHHETKVFHSNRSLQEIVVYDRGPPIGMSRQFVESGRRNPGQKSSMSTNRGRLPHKTSRLSSSVH